MARMAMLLEASRAHGPQQLPQGFRLSDSVFASSPAGTRCCSRNTPRFARWTGRNAYPTGLQSKVTAISVITSIGSPFNRVGS